MPKIWHYIEQFIQENHFEIIDRKILSFDFLGNTPKELIDVSIYSSWFINLFGYNFLTIKNDHSFV